MTDQVISTQAVHRRLRRHHLRVTLLVTFGLAACIACALTTMSGMLPVPAPALLLAAVVLSLVGSAHWKSTLWIRPDAIATTIPKLWVARPMPTLVRVTGGLRTHGPNVRRHGRDEGFTTEPPGLLSLLTHVHSASPKLRPYLVAYALQQAARHARWDIFPKPEIHDRERASSAAWARNTLAALRETHERDGDQVLEHVDPAWLNDLLRLAASSGDPVPLRDRIAASLDVDDEVAATLANLLAVRQPLPQLLDVARATLEQPQHPAAA